MFLEETSPVGTGSGHILISATMIRIELMLWCQNATLANGRQDTCWAIKIGTGRFARVN